MIDMIINTHKGRCVLGEQFGDAGSLEIACYRNFKPSQHPCMFSVDCEMYMHATGICSCVGSMLLTLSDCPAISV